MDREVTLMEMLEAREARAGRQRELLEEHRCPLVSFTLNIAGPMKNSPVLRRAFREGLERLEVALAAQGLRPLHQEEVDRPAGCEALWVVDGPARTVKELCAQIEDRDPLGRLFDLDVLDPEGGKWDREELGLPPRPCLVCGKAGKGCASRRLHPVEEIQGKTQAILRDFFAEKDRKFLAAQGARALLYEVCTTPKPGLVDRHNNGSHKDMDVFTFLDSTASLMPYLERAVAIGQATAHRMPEETFERLREAGLRAERTMLQATGGVNTHKGAIFSLGCVLGACGRLWTPEGPCRAPEKILAECGRMSAPAAESFFAAHPRKRPHRRRAAVCGDRGAGRAGGGGRRLPRRSENRSACPARCPGSRGWPGGGGDGRPSGPSGGHGGHQPVCPGRPGGAAVGRPAGRGPAGGQPPPQSGGRAGAGPGHDPEKPLSRRLR